MLESDVYRRPILTSNVGPRAERVTLLFVWGEGDMAHYMGPFYLRRCRQQKHMHLDFERSSDGMHRGGVVATLPRCVCQTAWSLHSPRVVSSPGENNHEKS